MKNLAIFYGGKSPEHDISIITAISVMKNLDKNKYNIIPVYVSENNSWCVPKDFLNLNIYTSKTKGKILINGFFDGNLIQKRIFGFSKYKTIDMVINCMHGQNGEDGTLAGLLELNNIPYVGSGVTASAVGMDKALQKDILKANNIPIAKYVYFSGLEFSKKQEEIIKQAEQKLNYPIVVKPANLGSSIGINFAKNKDELIKNIKIALNFDKKVILEEKINNLREINCSVIGNSLRSETSILEEPKNWQEFLDFNEKYLNFKQDKKEINVHLEEAVESQIKNLSQQVFELLGASGVARIDFLLDDQTKQVYVNEINTIPGSYANYLWGHKYTFSELLDMLIDLSAEEYIYKNKNKYTYKTEVLSAYSQGKLSGIKK